MAKTFIASKSWLRRLVWTLAVTFDDSIIQRHTKENTEKY